MYMEMGMNSADLILHEPAVDVPGVGTDPNACNNDGGAC
jgi:hypothetical protein